MCAPRWQKNRGTCAGFAGFANFRLVGKGTCGLPIGSLDSCCPFSSFSLAISFSSFSLDVSFSSFSLDVSVSSFSLNVSFSSFSLVFCCTFSSFSFADTAAVAVLSASAEHVIGWMCFTSYLESVAILWITFAENLQRRVQSSCSNFGYNRFKNYIRIDGCEPIQMPVKVRNGCQNNETDTFAFCGFLVTLNGLYAIIIWIKYIIVHQ